MLVYRFCRLLSFLLLRVFFGLEVRGRENIPKQGGFILASNHVSYIDPFAVGCRAGRILNYMAKAELFSGNFSNWFLRQLGCFPVKQDTPDLPALKEAIRRVRRGEGLLLFPEGTRVSGEVAPKAGVGFLTVKLGVPVIPAFVGGTEIVLPRGSRFFKFHKIKVTYGSQIPIERRMPYEDIARQVMQSIRRLSCSTS